MIILNNILRLVKFASSPKSITWLHRSLSHDVLEKESLNVHTKMAASSRRYKRGYRALKAAGVTSLLKRKA